MTTTSTIVAGMLQFLHPLFFDTNVEVNRAEIECLATNIYFEAAAEERLGKTAVAHVTLNRLHDPAYEHSVCNVVVESFAPGTKSCQFSWTCDGKPDEVPVDTRAGARTYEDCVEEAIFAYFGLTKDPTGWSHLLLRVQLGRSQMGSHREDQGNRGDREPPIHGG